MLLDLEIQILTQDECEMSRREQNLQTAVQERQQIVSVRAAELNKELLLSVAEGRLLRPVEDQNLTGHLTGNKTT